MSIRILNMPCRRVFSPQRTLGLGIEGPNEPSDAQLCSLFCFHPKVAPGYKTLFRPSAVSGHKHKGGLIAFCM